MSSFRKILKDLQPSMFFIQETKVSTKGKIDIDADYKVYELPRTNKGGGGIALGCRKELNPTLAMEGDDEVEALSIYVHLKRIKIRCCVGYGPQECHSNDKKEAFWNFLDNEVLEAKKDGAGFILQFDGNLWAGENIVPGDPREQNRNGKLFESFLERNKNLTVVNGLSICRGLITRRRLKDGVVEESVLDFFVVCDIVLPYVKQL